MNNITKIFFMLISIATYVNGQNMWFNYGLNDADYHLMHNLSIDSIKSIIINDNIEQSSITYTAAVEYLLYFYKDTETQFLLENLNTEIDTTLPFPEIYFQWDKIYTDTYIRGLLGDPTAINKMKTIAETASDRIKFDAIISLGQAGIYDYYDFVKSEYLKDTSDYSAMSAMALYGGDERYRDEIKTIFRNRAYSSDSYHNVISMAGYLSYIPGAELELLDEFFINKTGKERYDYFRELEVLDKEGQVERSIFALKNEPNDTFRVEYLPIPYKVLNWRDISKRYLEPKFVNFLTGLDISDTSSSTYQVKRYFLLTFIPIKPDSTKSINDLLDNLNNYLDSVSVYGWFGELSFSNTLKSILGTAKTNLQNGDSIACAIDVKSFQDNIDYVYKDSLNIDPRFVTLEGWKFLYWNAQYILDRLPEIPSATEISTYSLFATHSLWLEQNSDVLSGNLGVNEVGNPPFLDSQVELSIGIGTTTPAGYTVKGNRIFVKQSATVNSDVYYNELTNNGTLTGTQHTPLNLPLITLLPEFKSSTPGTQSITIPQNGVQTLQPGSYGDIQVKLNGKLMFTGGEYHINNFTAGEDNQIVFQSPSEVRIANKFDSGQGSYIGPEDTTTMSAKDIVFYVSGINGTNGNLGATPKAAKIGIDNIVKANFYVPNGTLWIRQNSEAEGAFIGKDLNVGIGVKVRLKSAF